MIIFFKDISVINKFILFKLNKFSFKLSWRFRSLKRIPSLKVVVPELLKDAGIRPNHYKIHTSVLIVLRLLLSIHRSSLTYNLPAELRVFSIGDAESSIHDEIERSFEVEALKFDVGYLYPCSILWKEFKTEFFLSWSHLQHYFLMTDDFIDRNYLPDYLAVPRNFKLTLGRYEARRSYPIKPQLSESRDFLVGIPRRNTDD